MARVNLPGHKYTSFSESDTVAFGYRLGQQLSKNSIVCFFGDLAAGKTTFIRGLAEGAGKEQKALVSSPTFVYLNIYKGQMPIYHFDLYRLHDADEFLSMGFDDFFSAGGICCIEWSERIASLLPVDCIHVEMEHAGENIRNITVSGK